MDTNTHKYSITFWLHGLRCLPPWQRSTVDLFTLFVLFLGYRLCDILVRILFWSFHNLCIQRQSWKRWNFRETNTVPWVWITIGLCWKKLKRFIVFLTFLFCFFCLTRQLSCVLCDWWCRISRRINLGSYELCISVQTEQPVCHFWHQPSGTEWPHHVWAWLGTLQEKNWSFWVRKIILGFDNLFEDW